MNKKCYVVILTVFLFCFVFFSEAIELPYHEEIFIANSGKCLCLMILLIMGKFCKK